MDQAKLGAEALGAGDYAEAIRQYTAALKRSPTSPDYLVKRSTAYQRSSPPDLSSALSDASNAVRFAQKRAKRELIIQAQLRRAITLFALERYVDARFVFDVVKRMDPKEKTLPIWEKKVSDKLAGAEPGPATVKETPDEEEEPAEKATENQKAPATAATPSAAPAQTPASKIRHDWYQNNDNVYFTLLAKGVPKDKATIDIQPQSLSISFPVGDSTYDFSLDPLFAPVDASASTSTIMTTKVEIVLKKAHPGRKWHALEAADPVGSAAATSTPTVSGTPAPVSSAPSYPTSSRTGPKNWDKITADLGPARGASAAAEGDDDDDQEGDAVNGFFKKLYASADPDVKRAMMKSFTESNGTALSTNWEEVRKAKVETSPPDGLEAKKWD